MRSIIERVGAYDAGSIGYVAAFIFFTPELRDPGHETAELHAAETGTPE